MNLKTARGGMSAKELANRIGVSYQIVYCYENGQKRPSPQVAEKIGKELGLTRNQLWDMFYSNKTPVTQ
jgi:ribosome-binding protein aMBF1 (putative translation factor)